MARLRKAPDPATIMLTDSFLLSDFMGCTSVYRHGHANPYVGNGIHGKEGTALAKWLEKAQERFGPVTIAYGYISPQLSRQIVKYQSPDKPSYHRWDDGAACDVIFHDRQTEPPIYTALDLDHYLPCSRLITYSESPYICCATRYREYLSGDPRRALYENRYLGERKPKFIRYPSGDRSVPDEVDFKKHDWKGAGYPTYHAGGVRGFEHYRVSRYTMLIDYLYDSEIVANKMVNAPAPTKELRRALADAGQVIDDITDLQDGKRISIVSAYRPDRHDAWMRGEMDITVCPAIGYEDQLIKFLVNAYPELVYDMREASSGILHVQVKGKLDE